MANPTITSAALNKAAYAPGETMTLTVNYSDPDKQNLQISIKVADSAGNEANASVNAVIDPSVVTVTSAPSKTWTKVSDTGAVAVFTAVA